MRTAWNGLELEAIDYEIVRIGTHVPGLGAFRDVHVSARSPWRLVAGYLMVQESAVGELSVFSHGHPVVRLTLGEVSAVWRAGDEAPWTRIDGVPSVGGVALVPAADTTFSEADGMVRFAGEAGWSATIVHGPAVEKVHNRIELLRSLEAVGGRHV